MEQFVTPGGHNPMHTAMQVTACTNCFKGLRPGSRSEHCKECRAKLRLRLMFEGAAKQATEAQAHSYKQPLMLTTCAMCNAMVQLPPYAVDPGQVIICTRCHDASLSEAQSQSSHRHAPSQTHPSPTPRTARTPQQQWTPQQTGSQQRSTADLDNQALAQYITSQAMKFLHPAHALIEANGSNTNHVRTAPEGAMILPASMLPPSYRPSPDGRHFNERGELMVPSISSYLPMPLPPPRSAAPTSHQHFTQNALPSVAKSNRASAQAMGPAPDGMVPTSSLLPILHPQHRGITGSSALVPNIRRSVPVASAGPPHLAQPPPRQPVTLPHFHAAVPPPTQASSDAQVRGWTQQDPQAAGNLRVCEASGCSTILSPKHVWRVCSKCLAAVDPGHSARSRAGERAKEQSQDVSATSSTGAAAGSSEQSKPRLRVATEPSPPPTNLTSAEAHHVLPMSASSQTSPSVLTEPPPIARSWRSASAEAAVSPVALGPRRQTPIAIPSLFPPFALHAQRARVPAQHAPADAISVVPSQFSQRIHPVQDAATRPHVLMQQMDTDAMLKHIESLVREHVADTGTHAQMTGASYAASQVPHCVERTRGGVGSSPVSAYQKSGKLAPKSEPRSLPLPLPRNLKRDGGAAKATTTPMAASSGSAEHPNVLDGEDVQMHSSSRRGSPSQAAQQVISRMENENDEGLSDVVMRDVASVAQSVRDPGAPVEEVPQALAAVPDTANVPPRAGTIDEAPQVKTEEPVKPQIAPVADGVAAVHMHGRSLPGDTTDEEEPPLREVVKTKLAREDTEEKPVICSNLKQKLPRTSSPHPGQATSTPLRIRIPSIRKFSPPRVDTSLRAVSSVAPDSPPVSSSPSSPALPPPCADTSVESDLSDLTPPGESTDEGESEVDEPDDGVEERPKLKIKLKIPKSLRTTGERRTRLRASRQEQKSPSTCNIRKCQNLLALSYRWKLCDICREYNRQIQRRSRREQEENDPEAKSKKQLVDLSVYAPGSRICTGRQCRTVIPPEAEYRWKMCQTCRRGLRKRDKYAALFDHPELLQSRKRARGDDDLSHFDLQYPDDDDDHSNLPYVDRTPDAYQCLDELVITLEKRFHAFFLAQLQYMQFKAAKGIDVSRASTTVFNFNGEYSIVANPAGGAVDMAVAVMVNQIQSAIGIDFHPAGVFPGPDASVISRFGCIHEIKIPLPPHSTPTSEAPVHESPKGLLVRRMVGELEFIVAWDRRHKYFPGQRIQIRLSLLS